MNNYIVDKVIVGISACQYGSKVRYNAKGWDMVENLKREKNEFIFYPICPELLSVMGVPREAISLRSGNGHDFWENKASIKNRSGVLLDDKIKKGCELSLELIKNMNIDVFIYMEGSPSCGVYRTSLKGKRLGNPPGTFGSLLLKEEIFLIPAVDLQSPIKWWDWRRRMYAYVWLKNRQISTMEDMYKGWHTVKFLCQELFRKESDEIGRRLAEGNIKSTEELKEIKKQIMDMLRKPSNLEKIKQSLWKNYKFLEKKKSIHLEEIKEPTDIRNMAKLAQELSRLEVVSREENLLFGASPIYRSRKGKEE